MYSESVSYPGYESSDGSDDEGTADQQDRTNGIGSGSGSGDDYEGGSAAGGSAEDGPWIYTTSQRRMRSSGGGGGGASPRRPRGYGSSSSSGPPNGDPADYTGRYGGSSSGSGRADENDADDYSAAGTAVSSLGLNSHLSDASQSQYSHSYQSYQPSSSVGPSGGQTSGSSGAVLREASSRSAESSGESAGRRGGRRAQMAYLDQLEERSGGSGDGSTRSNGVEEQDQLLLDQHRRSLLEMARTDNPGVASSTQLHDSNNGGTSLESDDDDEDDSFLGRIAKRVSDVVTGSSSRSILTGFTTEIEGPKKKEEEEKEKIETMQKLKNDLDDAIDQWESTRRLDADVSSRGWMPAKSLASIASASASASDSNKDVSHPPQDTPDDPNLPPRQRPALVRGSMGTVIHSNCGIVDNDNNGSVGTNSNNTSSVMDGISSSKRGSVRNVQGLLGEVTSRRLSPSSRRGSQESNSNTGNGSDSDDSRNSKNKNRNVTAETDADAKAETDTIADDSLGDIDAITSAIAKKASPRDSLRSSRSSSLHDSVSTNELIGVDPKDVARGAAAASYVSAARSAGHIDLNENIRDRQRQIERELARQHEEDDEMDYNDEISVDQEVVVEQATAQPQDPGSYQDEYYDYDVQNQDERQQQQQQHQQESSQQQEAYGFQDSASTTSRDRRAAMRGEEQPPCLPVRQLSVGTEGFTAATGTSASSSSRQSMGSKKVSFEKIVSVSDGSGESSSTKLNQDPASAAAEAASPQQQDDSARFSYSADMSDRDVLAKAKEGAYRSTSPHNVQIGAVHVGPSDSASSNLSRYQQEYLQKQQTEYVKTAIGGGTHTIHAASANRGGHAPEAQESATTLDIPDASVDSSVHSRTRDATLSAKKRMSRTGGNLARPGAYRSSSGPHSQRDMSLSKKIAANNGGHAAHMHAEVGTSDDSPFDRARSRKKLAAMGLGGMSTEVGVEDNDPAQAKIRGSVQHGKGADTSFARRKAQVGSRAVNAPVGRPGGAGMGGVGKLTAEMGVNDDDDEENGNGYYGRPLIDASSRWVHHKPKDGSPPGICAFRRIIFSFLILAAVTIGVIVAYVPMGRAHVMPFGQDKGNGIRPEQGAQSTDAVETDAPRIKTDRNDYSTNTSASEKPKPAIPGRPISPGTDAPFLAPDAPQWSTMSRAESIRATIEEITSDAAVLDDINSPQNRTLRWLVEEDAANVPQSNPPRIKQRYILALLYFSTGGDTWTNDYDFLSMKHECDWNGMGYDAVNDADTEQGVFCSNDKEVVELFIISNNMAGELPEELGFLRQVYSLSFWTNMIGGSIPASIGDLSLLKVLDFGSNLFTGQIPASIGKLTKLEEMYLDTNKLQYGIPDMFGDFPILHTITLSDNELESTIPASLAQLKSLKFLEAYSNQLEGPLPEIWTCKLLKELFLHDNKLTGSIPPTIYKRTMSLLDLSNNKLSGEINMNPSKPPMKLAYLLLSNNEIEGSIPPFVGSISTLEHVALDGNSLKGGIPKELSSLKQLKELHVNNNSLSGAVPAGICGLKNGGKLQDFVADCAGSSPAIECSCCTCQ